MGRAAILASAVVMAMSLAINGQRVEARRLMAAAVLLLLGAALIGHYAGR